MELEKSIRVSKNTWKDLYIEKVKGDFPSVDAVISELLGKKEKRGSFVGNDTLIDAEAPTATKRKLHDRDTISK